MEKKNNRRGRKSLRKMNTNQKNFVTELDLLAIDYSKQLQKLEIRGWGSKK